MADGSVGGFVSDRFAAVRGGFEANLASGADVGASFAATLEGETVVDLWGGWADEARARPWERDTIVNVYSTTKTMTALTALLLADRGELDFGHPGGPVLAAVRRRRQGRGQGQPRDEPRRRPLGWKEPITREDLYDWDKVTALLAAQAPTGSPEPPAATMP